MRLKCCPLPFSSDLSLAFFHLALWERCPRPHPMARPSCRFGAWLLSKPKSSRRPARPRPRPWDISLDRTQLCSYITPHDSPLPHEVLQMSLQQNRTGVKASIPFAPGILHARLQVAGARTSRLHQKTRGRKPFVLPSPAQMEERRAIAKNNQAMVAARAVHAMAFSCLDLTLLLCLRCCCYRR